jgi:hypothetical protein
MAVRLKYNAPIVLIFSLLSVLVLLIDQISGRWLIRNYFTICPDLSASSPLSWRKNIGISQSLLSPFA